MRNNYITIKDLLCPTPELKFALEKLPLKEQKGDTGAAGTNGINGINGIQGVQGIQGEKGDTGATGLSGANGTNGIDGAQGSIGLTGVQGIQGVSGLNGVDGANGPQGIQGIQGEVGLQGLPGTTPDQPQIFAKVGGVQTTNGISHVETEVAVRTGAVVIGATTAPTTAQTKLDVTNGDQDLDATTPTTGAVTKNGVLWEHNTGNNTYLGISAGNRTAVGIQSVGIGQLSSQNNTGNFNTAVGYLTMPNATGANNTAIGKSALSSNTTGLSNTSIGSNTLTLVTTGFNNTAVGGLSQAETTGSNNSSLGQLSMRQNTTGYQNTAIGAQALRDNTTGYSNIAVGFASLSRNIVGATNVGIGINALASNNASENVAVGVNSSVNNTTGFRNTAIGSYSQATNVVGNNNTSLGDRALYYAVDKIKNTAIGSGTFAATIYDNSTALGYFAQPTASNQFMLGDLAITEVRTAGAYFGTAFNIVSDKRNKYIGDVAATKTLFGEKINIYEYQLISDGSWHLGVIAQDVETIEEKRGRFILTSKAYGLNYGATVEQFNSILGTDFKFYSDINEQDIKDKIVEAQGITLEEAKNIAETKELVKNLKLEVDENGDSIYVGEYDDYLAKYIGFDLTGDETFRKYHVFEEDMLSLSTAINTILI